jgi:hypothetical protein
LQAVSANELPNLRLSKTLPPTGHFYLCSVCLLSTVFYGEGWPRQTLTPPSQAEAEAAAATAAGAHTVTRYEEGTQDSCEVKCVAEAVLNFLLSSASLITLNLLKTQR